MEDEKTEKEPIFTYCNIDVCAYCKNLAIAPTRDDWDYGCALRVPEKGDEISLSSDELNIGCERFESSGLPAHPAIYEYLIRQNPLAKNIPVDQKAIETSFDFGRKIKKYPHYRWNREFPKDCRELYKIPFVEFIEPSKPF